LIDSVSQLDTLDNQFLATVTQLFVLVLQRLTDLKQVQTLLLPDSSDRGVATLEHLQLKLHLLHLLHDLLRLDLLLDEFTLELRDFLCLSVLNICDLGCEVLCNALKLLALIILLAEHINQLVCVNVLVHLELLDLVFKFLQTLRF